MSDERTLAEFLGSLKGTLEKINDRLERLEGQPTRAEVESQESFPDWNEDLPSAPLLRLVPPEPEPIPEQPSALGEAFRSRVQAPTAPPASTVDHWEAIGSVPSVSETVRGDGHVLTNEEIAAHYRRDQAMRRNPGRTVEEEYAGRL